MVPQVRAVTLTSYSEVASYHGLDGPEMLRRFRITPEMLVDPENRLSAQSVCRLLEESARASACSTFGLAMAECRTFASFGPISLLIEHLGSVREIIDAVTEYRRHLNDIIILGIDETDGEEILRVELLAKFATPQAADLAIGIAYIALSGASRFRWRPESIHFSHSPPNDISRYKRFFAQPIEFRSSFNGFACSRDSLDTEWPWANDTMAGHARRLLTLVPLSPETAPLTERVMRVITLALPTGRATLTHVAAHFGKSPRALQRSLAEEGRHFAELLNEVRRSLVIQHLSTNSSSMTWIAAMLGYFSSSSFSRWFISEFGVPPRVWRSEQLRTITANVI